MALAVVLAFSFVFASTSAASGFHSENSLTIIHGSQVGTDVFTTTAGTVSCTEATYLGGMAGKEEAVMVVEPTFSGCTAFGFAGATFNTNGCDFELRFGTLDIQNCESAWGMVVTAKLFGVTKCTLTIPEQSGLPWMTFWNRGSGSTREIDAEFGISNWISYTHHAGSGIGACTSGSGTDGDFSGEARLTGTTNGSHIGIWYE